MLQEENALFDGPHRRPEADVDGVVDVGQERLHRVSVPGVAAETHDRSFLDLDQQGETGPREAGI